MLRWLRPLMRSRSKEALAERVRAADPLRAPPEVKEAGLRRVLAEFEQVQAARREAAERRERRRGEDPR